MGNFNQPSANRTYTRGHLTINPDGSLHVEVLISNEVGTVVDRFHVKVPLAGPIVDAHGNQLAASVPAGLNNARNAFLSAIDAAIDNAAAAGKFAR